MAIEPRWTTGEEFQDDITHLGNHLSLDQTGYWFWDETESWAFGPFLTQEETNNFRISSGDRQAGTTTS